MTAACTDRRAGIEQAADLLARRLALAWPETSQKRDG
jgi:hypothetical protein